MLVAVPFIVNQISRNFIFSPFIDYFWNDNQSDIFLNASQEERAFGELQRFEEKITDEFERILNVLKTNHGEQKINIWIKPD